VYGGFAVDGEQVWGLTTQEVVHFDGRNWQCWRDALASEDASSIAAGGGEAWVIDETGNLSHYAGGVWSISKLTLPGVSRTGEKPQWDHPELARTANGWLWLVWGGVWRFNGSGWAQVANSERPLKDARLLGVAGDRVWVSEGRDVFSVSADGRSWARYGTSEMGLPVDAWVSGASGDGPIWFATSAGLVAREGARWRLIAPPPGVEGLNSVAAALDGTVWVIGGARRSGLRAIAIIVLVIGVVGLLAMLALPVWAFVAMRYKAKRRREQMRTAVAHATGELPEEFRRRDAAARRKVWAEKGLALILAVATVFALRHLWPQTAKYWFLAVLIAYEFFSRVLPAIQRRDVKPSDPIGPGGPPKYDLQGSVAPVLWAIALFAFMRFDWLFDKLKVWAILLVPLALYGVSLLCARLADRAAARGDYDGALRLAGLLFWHKVAVRGVRSEILLAAGRYAEAETMLRQGIDLARRPRERSLMLEGLGNVLMEMGRYGEAQRCFEGARELMPKRSVADCCMAELLLRQGLDAEKALEFADRALKSYRGNLLERMICRGRIGEILATRAWALVLRARSAEAMEAIEAALKGPARKSRPAFAHVCYNAGMAMRALGNYSTASEHFGRGRDVDPTGRWGKLCAQALRVRSTWGAT
jgi:tetratricopeptide (TPR) repeat protein